MNITTLVLNRDFKNAGMDNVQLRKDAGLLDYKRNIIISIREKQLNDGIHNTTAVSKIGCVIINYSISNIDKDRRLYSKTTYLCDIDFEGTHFDKNILSRESIEKFGINKVSQYFNQLHIIPMYVYSNDHISYPDGSYTDFGLTLVELNNTRTGGGYNIVNFSSKETQASALYKEHIEGNNYNPKYYTNKEAKLYGNKIRDGVLNDYVDEKTNISWYPYTRKTVEYYIHNELQEGIHFNKQIAKSMNLLNDLFNDMIFVPKECFQFTYDNLYNIPLNINRVTFFTIFNKKYKEDRLPDLVEAVSSTIEKYAENEFKTKFRIEFTQREFATNLIVHFYDTDSTVVVQSPNDNLFSEYVAAKELELEINDENNLSMEKTMLIDDYYYRAMHMLANVSGQASAIANSITYQNRVLGATAQFLKDGSQDTRYLTSFLNNEAGKVLQKIEAREDFINKNRRGMM